MHGEFVHLSTQQANTSKHWYGCNSRGSELYRVAERVKQVTLRWNGHVLRIMRVTLLGLYEAKNIRGR